MLNLFAVTLLSTLSLSVFANQDAQLNIPGLGGFLARKVAAPEARNIIFVDNFRSNPLPAAPGIGRAGA